MPELPEVETIARQLRVPLKKRELKYIEIYDLKLKNSLLKKLRQVKTHNVYRLGKQIVLEFKAKSAAENKVYLAVHLRMTGRLIWENQRRKVSPEDKKHLRARMFFNGGLVSFYDTRRFGTFHATNNLNDLLPQGVEPLSNKFSVALLSTLLATSSQPIKQWLLRQDRIVGIGNIYASEILFAAKINPKRAAKSLNQNLVKALHKSTVQILSQAVKNCGTTFSDFQDAHGVTGEYQNYLKVYDRAGKVCPRCKKPIKRIVQQQRSTFYCGSCQR